ncbi:aspartate ammonia-lyase [Desulfofundulus thermobenzoicus]|uniref:Aspartate ammonia-lyase n=1 Tax=Desulfofundulus thermobenzoicus TaxID=29376 RepID=A0A6N7IP28_9FIRM|nr:aspartate ammonia-lyase [Desulfofundulus thermobenzoicus]MQL51347.1 aspartate ammonia-lyase [Desulfofundulus thermobenzoicus]
MPRVEHDPIGEREVPEQVYYGIQTLRALENFPITGYRPHPELVRALVMVKKAAAMANVEVGLLDEKRARAIIRAADEVLAGALADQFVVDVIQGGAGTSLNMNVNEVLANRAIELLGGRKGDYRVVSPNNHVNMSQSTNDVFPTAIRLACLKLAHRLLEELRFLEEQLLKKAGEFDDVIKVGRTHLQDAVPIRLGQEFGAYARAVKRDMVRVRSAMEALYDVNLGATAVGTGLNAKKEYIQLALNHLREISGFPVKGVEHLVDGTQNTDVLAAFSGSLRVLALTLSKMANDIRLMSSGPRAGLNEINLPPMQPGSSIMPGKVNPVIPEVLNQVAFQVLGNDQTIALAVEAGQLELNVMEPVIAFNLLQSLDILRNAIHVFRTRCLAGITANREYCRKAVERSVGVITALSPVIGYEEASKLAHEVLDTGKTVKELLGEKGLLTPVEVEALLDPRALTEPGIPSSRLHEDFTLFHRPGKGGFNGLTGRMP